MNGQQEQTPLVTGEENKQVGTFKDEILASPSYLLTPPIDYMERDCTACHRERAIECNEILSPQTLYYTPILPACAKRKFEGDAPIKFRNVRARLEAEQEHTEERNLLDAAKQALSLDGQVLPSTPQGRLGRSYKVNESRLQMRSLMSICRETWHNHLARAIPQRTKEQALAQFAECFEKIMLPVEVKEFLMEDRRLYFHDFPQVIKKATVDSEGKDVVAITIGDMEAQLDWDPYSELDTVPIELLNRMDVQACASCLRGSLEPNHQMLPVVMLEEEKTCWSPSFDFTGMNRSFLRSWACCENCRLNIKWRLSPIKALEGAFTVRYPPLLERDGFPENLCLPFN